MKDSDIQAIQKIFHSAGLQTARTTKVELEREIKVKTNFLENLPKIREKSLYVDWHESFNHWAWMGNYLKEEHKNLSYFLLEQARTNLNDFQFQTESFVNFLRVNGQVIGSTYPSYSGKRTMANYESIQEAKKIRRDHKRNKTRMKKGYKTFNKLIN